MCPALVRLINRERNRLGQLPLAPHEREKSHPGELLDELAALQQQPTPQKAEMQVNCE